MILILTVILLAHEWYPQSCCSDRDCRPVPCEDIKARGNFYYYQDSLFPKSKAQPSPDGTCHVCISSYKQPMCIFLGGMS